MKHFGDITKLSGYDLPVVDVITGGSPCQDLSVAGKRAGLAGERSGLFMEQIRIVKEMREKDERDNGRTGFLIRPRYMVWENVPGAFSSGKPRGADFAAVIEEIIKVAEPDANLCVRVPDNGWTKSGCYYSADGRWSLAWTVHNAAEWGVPQRRVRISLVADFGGITASEILFERKGMSWNPEQSGEERKEASGTVGNGIESTSKCLNQCEIQQQSAGFGETGAGYWQNGIQTLRAEGENRPSRPSNVIVDDTTQKPQCLNAWDVQSKHIQPQDGIAEALYAGECRYGGGESYVMQNSASGVVSKGNGEAFLTHEKHMSLSVGGGQAGQGFPCVMQNREPILLESNQNHATVQTDGISTALPASMGMGGGYVPMVTNWDGSEISTTLTSRNAGGDQRMPDKGSFTGICVSIGNGQTGTIDKLSNELARTLDTMHDAQAIMLGNTTSIVRRLTPLECERLQGFPDGWTDIGEWIDSKGKKHKEADSPRYKALGNSIALPFWQYLARRICAQYERPITMGSLFDGIGGFPLVFERCGAKAVWASEIEEFPIAVTKYHFPEKE